MTLLVILWSLETQDIHKSMKGCFACTAKRFKDWNTRSTQKGGRMVNDSRARKAKRGLLHVANRFNRESTTLIASWWWLILWTAYMGVAVLEPYMPKGAHQVTGTTLHLILAVMVVSFAYEAWEGWLGTMLMNCVISIPVVPVLLMVNIVRMLFGVEAWSFKQKAMFIGPQVLALALTFLHYQFTKKRWKKEPPPHLRPKMPSQPYRPDLAGTVKWAAVYLLLVLFAAGLFVLVLAKRIWSNFDIPVFWLALVLLILLLAALFAVFFMIDKKLRDR
jgi:hypothetical protein